VMGQKTANPTLPLYAAGERTTAGRRPPAHVLSVDAD
jgi:hypothetical protein